jgi:threonine dehydrogenase-like Zn-dependent dehydrogenase
MLALVQDGTPRLVHDYPSPRRAPGEALLRPRLVGLCDTDLQLARGYLGFRGVLGHEVVADVLEADDPTWVGRRVVTDINAGCGACADCLDAAGHHCAARSVLGILGRDGALAERFVMPERTLRRVPEQLTDEHAVFAEPLAAALHVLDELPTVSRAPCLVIGDGKLGLLTALALHAAGCPVTLIGHHRSKLDRIAALGIQTDLEQDFAPREKYAFVVEATGSEAGLASALAVTAPRGTLVLKTTTHGSITVDLAPLVIHEIRLVGSRCGDVNEALTWLAQIDPRPLIDARYPLARADQALEHAARRGTLKVLVSADA